MRKQRGGTELSEWHHSAVGLCSQAGHVTGRSDRVSQQLQNICWFAAVPRFMSQVLPYNQNCPQVPKATYSFLKSSVLQTQLCALWFFFFFFNISLPSFISNHVHLDLDLKCLPGLWLPELFPSVPNSSWFRNWPSTSQHIGAQPEPLPVPHQALTSLLDLVPHHKLCLRTRQSWQTLPWWDATVRCPWVAGPQWEMGCQADGMGQHGKPDSCSQGNSSCWWSWRDSKDFTEEPWAFLPFSWGGRICTRWLRGLEGKENPWGNNGAFGSQNNLILPVIPKITMTLRCYLAT